MNRVRALAALVLVVGLGAWLPGCACKDGKNPCMKPPPCGPCEDPCNPCTWAKKEEKK
jgi:hypothetical protein